MSEVLSSGSRDPYPPIPDGATEVHRYTRAQNPDVALTYVNRGIKYEHYWSDDGSISPTVGEFQVGDVPIDDDGGRTVDPAPTGSVIQAPTHDDDPDARSGWRGVVMRRRADGTFDVFVQGEQRAEGVPYGYEMNFEFDDGVKTMVWEKRGNRGRWVPKRPSRRDDTPDDRGRDRDRREPDRRRSNERTFTSMGKRIREIKVDDGFRYEILMTDEAGRGLVWEELVGGQRYRVVQRGKVGTAAWDFDVPGLVDFQQEGAEADRPTEDTTGADQAKQLTEIFGEAGAQIRQSLEHSYKSGHFDLDVVDELIEIELNLAGVTNRREVETVVGALRDIAGITTDRWPDAQERALLKTIAGKLGVTRALRELYDTLKTWYQEETEDFILEFVPRVLEASNRGGIAGLFKGKFKIDRETFTDDLRAAARQVERNGVAGLLRRSLRGVPEPLRNDIVDAVWLFVSGDDHVENTRAFGMRERIKIYKGLPRR